MGPLAAADGGVIVGEESFHCAEADSDVAGVNDLVSGRKMRKQKGASLSR